MGVNVPCQRACPAATNIPAYIRALYEDDPARSYEINRLANIFPGVLGRICSRPCEDSCRHGEAELGRPVNICHLKRAGADLKRPGPERPKPLFPPRKETVGVVGSGPAGLAAAHDLASLGFGVKVYEAFDRPGGMLRYGIPEFRLPRGILEDEIQAILDLGVEVLPGVRIGRDIQTEELLSRHQAVLVAAGCYTPTRLRLPGEELAGVHPGLEFMIRVTSGDPPAVGRRVLVLGAGFTAFDCARSALRLGAEEVAICLRRTEEDLRVTRDEILETKREGIRLEGLLVARRLLGQEGVTGVEFARTRLGDPDQGGRRKVVPIEGSEFVLPAETVIVATGQRPEAIGSLTGGTAPARSGGPPPLANPEPGLYLCGDFLTGPSTVIEAVASGRRAAERIARDLSGRAFREPAVRMEDFRITDRERIWDFIPRQPMPTIERVEDRLRPATAEVELGLSEEAAREESKRCYLCYLHYEIDPSVCIYCRYCIDVAPRDCIKLVEEIQTDEQGAIVGYKETASWREVNAVVIDNSRCIRCGECVRVCPVDCISVTRVEQVERLAAAGGD